MLVRYSLMTSPMLLLQIACTLIFEVYFRQDVGKTHSKTGATLYSRTNYTPRPHGTDRLPREGAAYMRQPGFPTYRRRSRTFENQPCECTRGKASFASHNTTQSISVTHYKW